MPPASELTHTRSSAGVSERRSEGRLLCVLFTCRREKVESLEREGPQDASCFLTWLSLEATVQ